MNLRTLRTPAFLVALGLLVLASVGMGAIRSIGISLRKLPIYPPGGRLLNSIPRKTKNWLAKGPDRLEEGEVLQTLGTNNYLTRTYFLRVGDPKEDKVDENVRIEFHTAYYTGMIDTVPHVPDRCFIAGGMQLAGLTRDLPLPLNREPWRLDKDVEGPLAGHIYYEYSSDRNRAHLPRDPQDLKIHSTQFLDNGHDLFAGYFFIANGGAVPRAEDVRLLAFDLHSTYAYYLKVQFTSSSVGTDEELASRAASLLDDILGDLMECVPDWVEVEAGNYPADNPARRAVQGTQK